MNFKTVLNDVCCDNRIKNGTIDLKNPDHVFVLQEYLEKYGYDIDLVVERTAMLFEKGRFPERQAYNADGILVTFPNKQYRDRAVRKGTHFAENPKKSQANIFAQQTDTSTTNQESPKPEEPQGAVPIDKELGKDNEEEPQKKERTPREKQIDSVAVSSILTGESPLVNFSVDEAIRYGFYKKGYQWYDSDGELIGEQIYDEKNGKLIAVEKANLSTIVTKSLKKIDILDKELAEILQIIKTGGVSSKDDTFKTDIYETLPLLVLYGIDNLSNAKNLGKDSIPRAIEFLTRVGNLRSKLEKIVDPKTKQENIKIYDAAIKSLYEIGGSDGSSLKDVFSQSPTDFIHKSIEQFYVAAKKYDEKFAGSEKGKKNTADVVLIYGGSANDVLKALNDGQIEDAGNSVVKVKNKNIYFALVSLKALSGRVGRVFTQLRSYLDADVEIQPSAEYEKTALNEGFFSTVKNTFDKFIKKYKEISDTIKDRYKTIIDSFSQKTGLFVDKIKTDMFQSLNQEVKTLEMSSFKELKKLEDSIEKEVGVVNEDKEKCAADSAALTISLKKNLEDYSKLLRATNNDTVLIEKIIETANNPTVTKYFLFDISEENLQQVKQLKHNVKSIASRLANLKEPCVSREELSPVLMYRSNILALQCIDLIMKKVLQDVNLSNPDKIQEEFINLASVLSTEAIFGGNVSLPLIKYTGNKLERLGYKKEFKIKVPETIPDLKLGKISVSLEPKQKAYMVIYMYLFFGIETEDDIVTPVYVVYEMRNESGSSFTFKVEGNKFTTKL